MRRFLSRGGADPAISPRYDVANGKHSGDRQQGGKSAGAGRSRHDQPRRYRCNRLSLRDRAGIRYLRDHTGTRSRRGVRRHPDCSTSSPLPEQPSRGVTRSEIGRSDICSKMGKRLPPKGKWLIQAHGELREYAT